MSVLDKGDEEGLRHVEKDVLIPKKMKAKAMKLCEKYVKGNEYLACRKWRLEYEISCNCHIHQNLKIV